jgi:hypothetical protein
MKVNFRQGIVSSYAAGLTPLFLAPSSTAGFIDLVVSPEPTVVSFAHGGSDYLQVFNTDVTAAWGPVVSGQDNFLYWEIDQLTANVLFKITRYPLLATSTAPVAPPVDQHWFDLATTTMKYWTGTKWLPKIAVFAGSVPSGSMSLLQPYGYGSQVGVNTPADPGFVMLSSLLKPIYTNPATFEFLTTTKSVRIKTTAGTSGVLATPPNAFIPVRASENIPAFSLVYFSGEDTVGLASSNPALMTPRIPIGIVQVDLSANEMGNVTQNGEVQWDQWDWSAHIGQPLYCTSNGQITTVRPSGLMAYRVGFVKNKDTILFNVDAETMPQIYQAMPNDIIVNGVAPLSSTFSTNGIGERIWTVEISDATTSQRGAMTAAQATLLDTHTTQIADNTADILTKAPIVHTHVIGDVDGLQIALDGKSPVGHNHDLLYSPLSHNHDTQYSPLGHAHIIGDVTGLQNALNLKADLTHSHVIGDVTGLQMALDDKFTTATDLLPMAQVTGLASALALKSDVGHVHSLDSLSDVGTAGAVSGNVLTFNGSTWAPAASSGGLPAGPTTSLQFNNAGVFGGSSKLLWTDASNRLTIGTATASASITMPTGNQATTTGNLSIVGSRNDGNGNGGDVLIFPGIAFGSGNNGTITLSGQNAQGSGVSGSIRLEAGGVNGGGTGGGTISITTGTTVSTTPGGMNSGTILIQSGAVGNNVGTAGLVTVAGGDAISGNTGTGGSVLVRGGNAGSSVTTGVGGNVDIRAGLGSPTAGTGGHIKFSTGPLNTTVERMRIDKDGALSFGGGSAQTPSGTGSSGQVLTSNGAAPPTWQAAPVPSLGSINGHTDVDTVTVAPAIDNVLKWNGTNWVPGTSVASGLPTVIVPLGAPQGTFVFRSLISEFTYMSAYSTYLAGYYSDWEGNFNQSSIAAGTTFPSAKIVDLSGVLGPRASVLGDTEQVAPEEICEFEFIGTPEMGKYFFVGWFQQAFGPAFSPTAEYGGPLTSWYHSSPSTAAIYGYGGVGSQSDLTPWQTGDVLGVIYGGPGNGITFFRNGVLVGSVGRVNTGGFPMCGYAVLS